MRFILSLVALGLVGCSGGSDTSGTLEAPAATAADTISAAAYRVWEPDGTPPGPECFWVKGEARCYDDEATSFESACQDSGCPLKKCSYNELAPPWPIVCE